MQPGKSPLTGPLWLIAVGVLMVGVGVLYIATTGNKPADGSSVTGAQPPVETARGTASTRPSGVTASTPPKRAPATPPGAPSSDGGPATPVGEEPTATAGDLRSASSAAVASVQPGSLAGTDFDLSGRVVLLGTPPPEKPLPLDTACGKLHPDVRATTRFYVTGISNGLADVLVYVKSGLEGGELAVQDVPLVIDQKGCEYIPYISAAWINQAIIVKNSDPLLHNVHPTPTVAGNPESNRAQLPGGAHLKFVFPQPELFLRFKCDVHPWMFSYVSILPHPFFAVTDANGEFHIPNLPPGKYVIKAIHRKAGTLEQKVTVAADGTMPPLAFEFKAR